MKSILTYWVLEGKQRYKPVRLTVFSENDTDAHTQSEFRRLRLKRILAEALQQDARLGYSDLEMILLSSRATIKRDIRFLRDSGVDVNFKRSFVAAKLEG
jgi:hypothetical protein